jgi:hypothetical protein
MTNLDFIGTKKVSSFYILKCVMTSSILLLQTPSFAQRGFGVCDSTTYILNNDTTVVAGRNNLYLYFNNTLQNLYNFSTLDTNEYIRDFDIVNPNLWFAVIGSRYIGNETRLYKSSDKGTNWSLDTNHHNATNVSPFLSTQFLRSINNFQHLDGDTLILFTGYYESGIIYSTDLGQTWTKWFDNLISHYQGMFECGNKYYVFGYEGDGFSASMFGFNKDLLFSSDSTGLWLSYNPSGYHPPCYGGGDTINCIYPPYNINSCEVYSFFKNRIDTLCSALGVGVENNSKHNLRVYPNPFNTTIRIEGASGGEEYHLINLYGQTMWRGKNIEHEDFSVLQPGLYFLQVAHQAVKRTIKLIKQ